MTLVPSSNWSRTGRQGRIWSSTPAEPVIPSRRRSCTCYDDRYEIVRDGVYDQRIIERLLRTTMLFVCSGNTCRSPMAEALRAVRSAKKLQVQPGRTGEEGHHRDLGGSSAMPGARATPQAVEAVQELGADLSQAPLAAAERRADSPGGSHLHDGPLAPGGGDQRWCRRRGARRRPLNPARRNRRPHRRRHRAISCAGQAARSAHRRAGGCARSWRERMRTEET